MPCRCSSMSPRVPFPLTSIPSSRRLNPAESSPLVRPSQPTSSLALLVSLQHSIKPVYMCFIGIALPPELLRSHYRNTSRVTDPPRVVRTPKSVRRASNSCFTMRVCVCASPRACALVFFLDGAHHLQRHPTKRTSANSPFVRQLCPHSLCLPARARASRISRNLLPSHTTPSVHLK